MNFLYDELASGSEIDTSSRVRIEVTKRKHAETRVIPEFPPVTEVRLVGGVCASPTCKAQRHNRLTLFSDESRHKDRHKRPIPRLNPPSTMGPSTRWTPDLYNCVGHTPTT